MLTYHQQVFLPFIWGQIPKRYLSHHSLRFAWKLKSPRCQWVNTATIYIHSKRQDLIWTNLDKPTKVFVFRQTHVVYFVCLFLYVDVLLTFMRICLATHKRRGNAVPGIVSEITYIMMPFQPLCMMASSNGNIFRVTGPLCGEFTGHR